MSSKLTKREVEIRGLVFKGFSNQEIASQLNLSIHTIKSHVSHVLQKTGSKSRVELITKQINNL